MPVSKEEPINHLLEQAKASPKTAFEGDNEDFKTTDELIKTL